MTEDAPRRPDRIRPKTLIILVSAFCTVVAVLFAVSLWIGGPIGWFVGKPSPANFVQQSLRAMEHNGYYAEGPAWQAARREAVDATRDASSVEATFPALQKAATVAGGPGSVFEPIASTPRDTKERPHPEVTRAQKITTVTVGERSGLSAQQEGFYGVDLAAQVKTNAPETCGWLLDLRGAKGGSLVETLAALSPLLPAGPLVEVQTRHAQRQKLTLVGQDIEWDNVVKGKGPSMTAQVGPVVALVGPETSGAAEALALALERRPETVIMGEKTQGRTGVTFTAVLPERTLLAVVGGMVAAPGKAPATEGVVPSVAGNVETATQWLTARCG